MKKILPLVSGRIIQKLNFKWCQWFRNRWINLYYSLMPSLRFIFRKEGMNDAGPRVRACMECISTIGFQSTCPKTLQQVSAEAIMRTHLNGKTQFLLINYEKFLSLLCHINVFMYCTFLLFNKMLMLPIKKSLYK